MSRLFFENVQKRLRGLACRLERVCCIESSMWTWEVSVPFDENLSEAQLVQQFFRDYPETSKRGIPSFWRMLSFNGEAGRKIRCLVSMPNESLVDSFTASEEIVPLENKAAPEKSSGWANPLAKYRRKYDRVLPKSILLYGLSMEIIQNESRTLNEKRTNEFLFQTNDSNHLFMFLVDGRLYILVFCEGRLCHWSEECGYEDCSFESEIVEDRIQRFRKFLEQDEFFAGQGSFAEHAQYADFEELARNHSFSAIACDSFWRFLDMDSLPRMKPLLWRMLCALIFAASLLGMSPLVSRILENPSATSAFEKENSALLELDEPPVFTSAERKRQIADRSHKVEKEGNPETCNLMPIKLRSVVKGRVFQGEILGEMRWFQVGDSVGNYEVVSIERDRVRLACRRNVVEVGYER